MEQSANAVNYLLQNSYLRNFIFMLSAIFLGYTLQPVPLWMNHLFNTSHIFKFLIIFISSVSIFYPMDKNEMLIAFISSFFLLIAFNIFRSKEFENFMNKLLNIKYT